MFTTKPCRQCMAERNQGWSDDDPVCKNVQPSWLLALAIDTVNSSWNVSGKNHFYCIAMVILESVVKGVHVKSWKRVGGKMTTCDSKCQPNTCHWEFVEGFE